MTRWGDITARARELADRERRLYDQRTIPAVLEELAAENEALRAEAARLRAEAENSAAQRDEAVLRAAQAEEAKRAVEAVLSFYADDAWKDRPIDPPTPEEVALFGDNILDFPMPEVFYDRGERARAELARIRSDRQKGEAL